MHTNNAKSKFVPALALALCWSHQALAEIVTLQTDTADQLMPLANRIVIGLIISSTIFGLCLIISSHLSRKK